MTLHVEDIFRIPLIIIEIDNWQEKKDILFKKLPIETIKKCEGETIRTNYKSKDFGDSLNIQEVFGEEISKIEREIDGKLFVDGSWLEVAEKGMYHEVHNHGQIGLSAVCYLQYDPKIHTPISFISPFNNFFNGSLIKCSLEKITEGIIIVFPSFLQHFTYPNESEELRISLSFNMKLA